MNIQHRIRLRIKESYGATGVQRPTSNERPKASKRQSILPFERWMLSVGHSLFTGIALNSTASGAIPAPA